MNDLSRLLGYLTDESFKAYIQKHVHFEVIVEYLESKE